MNKQMHVAFITQKLKGQFQYLKEGKFEDQHLYKFIPVIRTVKFI